jgi:CMP-N-acetylneuraminic acid synthetase
MKKDTKFFCFIPARAGSSRVKNKNIRLINKRPLIYWTVLKALKSKMFDKIIFSSDSSNYYKILLKYLKKDNLKYPNLVFDKRDLNHSKTKSKIFDYIKYDLINKFNLKKKDLIVQMMPTCPLRSVNTIKKTIKFSIANNMNCFSVCEYDFHITFALELKNNKWEAVFNQSPIINGKTQSQSQKKYYHPTGVINCLFVKSLNKNSKSIYKNSIPLIIPKSESFDIDTEEDLITLKKLFSSKNIN